MGVHLSSEFLLGISNFGRLPSEKEQNGAISEGRDTLAELIALL